MLEAIYRLLRLTRRTADDPLPGRPAWPLRTTSTSPGPARTLAIEPRISTEEGMRRLAEVLHEEVTSAVPRASCLRLGGLHETDRADERNAGRRIESFLVKPTACQRRTGYLQGSIPTGLVA